MIANFVTSALSPKAVGFAVKYLARPALYLACLWLIWSWDADRIAAERKDAETIERLKWQSEIAASNAAIAEKALAAERAAREADARFAAESAAHRNTLAELERANAALPNAASGGLDRDRVRLLRNQSR